MSGSFCRVILIGHLGRDPEVRSFQNGGRVANLSIATSETWRDKTTGERKQATQWHRIAVHNDGLVGVIEKYVKKGSKVLIEGALETRKWTDQSGQEKYTTEVVIRPYRGTLTLLDSRRSNSSGDADDDLEPGVDAPSGRGGTAGSRAYQDNQRRGQNPLDDDSIPF